jgi:transposase-like protein
MIKPVKSYSAAFKRKVVVLVTSGKESVFSVSQRFGIGGSMTVYRWIKQFQDAILQKQTTETMPASTTKGAKNAPVPSSISADQSLHEEIEMLRLKVLAYETMIDIAERELGISIKKKSSAKQSPPSEMNDPSLR